MRILIYVFLNLGTDEKVIIDILSGHNNAQRQIIKKKYKTIYGRVSSTCGF